MSRLHLLIALAFLIFGSVLMHVNIKEDAKRQLVLLEQERERMSQQLLNPDSSNVLYNPQNLSAAQLELSQKLQRHFVKQSDAATGTVWYVHARWRNKPTSGTQLSVKVSAKGELQLQSWYAGNRPLYHQQVFVKVNDQLLDSSLVKQIEQPEYLAVGRTEEKVTYFQPQDEALIKVIALSSESTLPYLLAGETRKEEAFLSAADLQAIRECYEMSLLLKEV